jgi:membrane-anchored protein YejM (alkaline phosphatase superfamily)
MTTHNDLAPTILTDALGCTTPSAAYSLGWPLRQTKGRRDFFAVVDYNDTGMYEPDRITLFSPFGGFPGLQPRLRPARPAAAHGTTCAR